MSYVAIIAASESSTSLLTVRYRSSHIFITHFYLNLLDLETGLQALPTLLLCFLGVVVIRFSKY